jgi:uncharacterized protein YndB with AHSA1/START domain
MSATSPKPELQARIERVIDAPRDRVFAMWTKQEHVERWWLPDGYTDPKIEIDMRVGGEYRYAMTPPEGERFSVKGKFLEINAPARLVYTWQWEGLPPEMTIDVTEVTVVFAEVGGKTRLTIEHTGFDTAEMAAKHDEGWNSCLDRLAKGM